MDDKYPTPKPDQKNANYNHGTGPDKAAKESQRGTMGHRNGGATGGKK